MSDTRPTTQAGPAQGAGRWNLWFGLATLLFALVCLLWWFPQDIPGGFTTTSVAGRTVPGDAFFPILLVGLIVPLALLQLLGHWRSARTGAPAEEVGGLTRANLLYLGKLALLLASWLAVTTWSGPLLVALWVAATGAEISGYRALSGTFPVNVLGFVLGAFWLICNLILMTRHTLRGVDVLAAAAVIAVLVLIFAGLLDDVLLPPNADL
jgi:hypothetical protein